MHSAIVYPRRPSCWPPAPRRRPFDHSPFVIGSGPHAALSCTDRHLNPGNLQAFSRTHCHDHRQSEADSEHSEVNGYMRESNACYSCHPTGRD